MDFFDHRAGSYAQRGDDRGFRVLPETSLIQYQDQNFAALPYYWVQKNEIESRIDGKWCREWFMSFAKVTAPTNSRTLLPGLFPRYGSGDSVQLILLGQTIGGRKAACLYANLCSLTLDYVARQKVGGVNLNYYLIRQLPVLAPTSYSDADVDFIVPRVLELTYTAHDLSGWAQDLGYDGEPFTFDPDRRATLRAELDAYYAKLYGLTCDELRYILDPADIMGEDYPSETFRVLKNKELKEFDEYRTQRLVLEAWDQMEKGNLL